MISFKDRIMLEKYDFYLQEMLLQLTNFGESAGWDVWQAWEIREILILFR
jgi:hypothetical protein